MACRRPRGGKDLIEDLTALQQRIAPILLSLFVGAPMAEAEYADGDFAASGKNIIF
jgi:hypothetical protein